MEASRDPARGHHGLQSRQKRPGLDALHPAAMCANRADLFLRSGHPTKHIQFPADSATRDGAAGSALAVGMCRKNAQINAEISPSKASP
jgi:hypothetical protein